MRRVRSDGQDLRRRLQIQWQGIVVVIRVLVDVVALLEVVDDALRGLHVRHKGCLQAGGQVHECVVLFQHADNLLEAVPSQLAPHQRLVQLVVSNQISHKDGRIAAL